MSIKQKVLFIFIFFSISQNLHAENFLEKNQYMEFSQELADLFFKKLAIPLADFSANFIVEQSDHQVSFFSDYDACSSHPKTSKSKITQVYRIEILQKSYHDHIYEEFTHYSCRNSNFVMKEVLRTEGVDLKPLSREQILKMNRKILAKDSTRKIEYTLYGGGDSASPVFQITSEQNPKRTTVRSNNTIFYSDENYLKNSVQIQRLSIQFPVVVKFSGGSWSYSSTDQKLSIEERKNFNPWYFVEDQRVSLIQFQGESKNSFVNVFDFTLGAVAKNILTQFPKTESSKPANVTLFQIEFLKNLGKVQAGDFSTIKDFMERLSRGINNGKVIIQDNGF